MSPGISPAIHRCRFMAVMFVVLACAPTWLFSQTSPTSIHQNVRTAEAVLREASSAKQAGDTEHALALYAEAVELDPRFPETRWQFGTTLYDLDRYKEAEVQFRSLVEFAPQSGMPSAMLGLCEYETKEFAESRSHLERARELGIPDPEVERIVDYHMALLWISDKEFDRATEILTSKFVSSAGVPSQIRVALGLALLRIPSRPEILDIPANELAAEAGGAAVLFALRRFNEAEAALMTIANAHAKTPFVRLALAKVMVAQGRSADAMRQLTIEEQVPAGAEEARNLRAKLERGLGPNAPAPANPKKPNEAPSNVGGQDSRVATLAKQAEAEAGSGHLEMALETYRKALQIDPTWREGLMNAGLIAYSRDDFKDASSFFQKVTEIDSSAGTAFVLLGLCEYQGREYSAAFNHLRRGNDLGMQASPEAIVIAKYHLGILYNMNGEFERALPMLKEVSGVQSLNSQAKFAMGMNLLRIAKLPEDLPKTDRELVNKAGEIATLLTISHYPKAFEMFDELLRQNPSERGIHNAYGWALMSISRFDEAEAQFRAESALDAKDAAPVVGLAMAALKARQLELAIESSKRAVALAPRSARTHEIYGRALLESSDNTGAIRELETAIGISSDLPEAHFSLARAYAKASRPADAERERQLFLRSIK
jgi:tetratricopeptide (TPR) repeat protein